MKGVQIHTKTAGETRSVGVRFARILKTHGNPFEDHACVIALTGNVGAGKTTFTQGFARGLGIRHTIQSPTFVLMKRFPLTSAMRGEIPFKTFYHLDCYRLESLRDLKSLKLDRVVKDPNALVLIEWAERAATILPRKHMRVKIALSRGEGRMLTFL